MRHGGLVRLTLRVLCLLLLLPLSDAAAQRGGAPPLTAEALSGLTLRTIGPATMSGRIVDLAVVERDPYVFYVASATGGLWKTTNNGITFTPVFQNEGTHSIGDVAVHQADTSVVWVGTGERANRQSSSWGDGVYKSTDGGRTWRNMGLRESRHIGRIVLHPTNPDIVYVAAMGHLWGPNEERGLYKSTDGGETWERILYIDENTGVVDVAMDPSDPNILYAAAYQRRRRAYGFHGGGPGSGLYRSTDGGETWTKLTDPALDNGLPEGELGRIGISIYRSDPRIVFVSVEQGLRYNASTRYEERRAGIYRSDDRGETWRHLTDWNPRPMYASQILVDPNDDGRIYMMNQYSYWDDVAKEVVTPRQSLHGDDRILWVDPRDSRHVIKGDDGGLGISYDRGQTWLYVTSLPVSQFYRVAVDMRKPYWVYGGLQDNGSWAGPSATYRSEGILNGDWVKTGGGDGFFNLPDTTKSRILYTESQYLGLSRLDLETHERQDIRPGDPTGHISARRNWDVWGKDVPTPPLGNAMEPANWDGPFLISPHDPATLYAGTDELWKSTDRGRSWTSLGDLTTGVDRSTLEIMGQRPDETTLSLDDGIPYFPTITAIAESPLEEGVLYVGTDDGTLQVSRDGGTSWTNVYDRLPGLPDGLWVAGIEASQHDPATVYVAVNGYRSDDYGNYLYRSTDYGESWESIVGDLPAERVIRTVREDPKNPDLVYIGTELGFFLSIDGGRHWVELENNLPTVAVNDFVIHPRDNDLVLGTHGRGIWILDNITALQELTPEVLASDAHLFSIEPAEMIRYARRTRAHAGDMIFRGENPPAGAIIDYYLREVPEDSVVLSVHDADGRTIRTLEPTTEAGINRVVWDLRYPDVKRPGSDDTALRGAFVVPGEYRVRLAVGDRVHEQRVQVLEDPRLDVPAAERREWTQTLQTLAGMYRSTAERLHGLGQWLDDDAGEASEHREEAEDLREQVEELTSRIRRLYWAVSGWTGRPTADQYAQMDFLSTMMDQLLPRADALIGRTVSN